MPSSTLVTVLHTFELQARSRFVLVVRIDEGLVRKDMTAHVPLGDEMLDLRIAALEMTLSASGKSHLALLLSPSAEELELLRSATLAGVRIELTV